MYEDQMNWPTVAILVATMAMLLGLIWLAAHYSGYPLTAESECFSVNDKRYCLFTPDE